MDEIILKEIKANLKEQMKTLNFKIKGQSYIRVVNKQIYQEINFQGFSGGDRFTINIAIKPICGIKAPCYKPTMRIGNLIYGQDKWWNYNTESENEVVEIIKNKIIPLFEKLSSYEKFYEEIKSEINDIPLLQKNWKDIKVHIWKNTGTENLFWLCFRNGDYDKCKMILKKYKIETQEWLKNNLNSTDNNIRNTQSKKYNKIFEEYKESFEKSANKIIRNIENLESLLENNEIEVMSEMIKEIESENLKRLERYVF